MSSSEPSRDRRAYVCPKCAKDTGVLRRIFLLPGETRVPSCPLHGGKMVPQGNEPYLSRKASRRS